MPSPQTSYITLLTPRGRGAVATLRFEGNGEILDVRFQAANGKRLSQQPLDRVVFGHWGQGITEEVVLCRISETVAEIHCHGGEAAAARIQSDLVSLNCQRESWLEMFDRTQGVFQREWTEAISKATTKRTAGILLTQRELFPQTVRCLLEQTKNGTQVLESVQAMLSWAKFGLHLTQPWEVVLGGPPNVGKSSLINALVGYARSIVFDQPGTTRDIVTADTAFAGWPIRFADTAGLRAGADALEAEGIERATIRLRAADCQILLFNVSQALTNTDIQLRDEFPQALLVAHKCDLPTVSEADIPEGALWVSSRTGQGMEELAEAIVRRLIPQTPDRQQVIPFTSRQIELLRQMETVLHQSEQHAFQQLCQLLLN